MIPKKKLKGCQHEFNIDEKSFFKLFRKKALTTLLRFQNIEQKKLKQNTNCFHRKKLHLFDLHTRSKFNACAVHFDCV